MSDYTDFYVGFFTKQHQAEKQERTLEEVKQLAAQRGCIVLEVRTKEGVCIILFDDWFIDGPIMRVEANHYGYGDACQWLEQFAGREELQSEVNMAELPF